MQKILHNQFKWVIISMLNEAQKNGINIIGWYFQVEN